MRAIIITQAGGPEVLELREVADPQPGPGKVLVRVRYSALNRADILQRQGKYPAPAGEPQDIPGLEFAGEVAEAGSGVGGWKPGDRVFGIAGGGAHSELIVADPRMLARIPDELSTRDAGAVPEAFVTAHDALCTQARLVAGERALVHAVGSGVGLAAIQLIRSCGAIPYGTSRTAEKIEKARRFGLEDGVALNDVSELLGFAERIHGKSGFDVMLDLVGGPYLAVSIFTLALKGRIVVLASMGGPKVELDTRLLLSRRLTIKGSVLRSRPLAEKIAATEAFARDVLPWLASGEVKPCIDSEFAMDEIRQAHLRLESNQTMGKVLLRM